MVRVLLCSDEMRGENAPILIPAAELAELSALGYRPVRMIEGGGGEVWQGPVRTMATAYKRWRERGLR